MGMRQEKKEKRKKEKRRKSTQATIAHSSNIGQQIIIPSLQLINSHLVIDINKREGCFYFRVLTRRP